MGNICRSPAAEGVLRSLAAGQGITQRLEIASAGTIGMHAGELPDARMRAAAARRGYALTSRARQVVAADLDRHDFIFVMDDDNRRGVLSLASTDAQRAKVHSFVELCSAHDDVDVPDPYYGGEAGFEHVLDLLEDGCRGFLTRVSALA